MRILPTLSLALAFTGLTSAAWPGTITKELRSFTITGGGVYSPAYECEPRDDTQQVCAIPSEREEHYGKTKLDPATVVYKDADGEGHVGRLSITLTRYIFRSRIVFKKNPGASQYHFSSAEGSGVAEAAWAMRFGDGSFAGGTFVARDIEMKTADGYAVLRIPFGVQVTTANGPLVGEAGEMTGACPRPDACTSTSVLRFRPDPRTLEGRPPAEFSRALASALKPKGRMKVALKPGKPKIYFALPRNGLMTSFAKHHLVAVGEPKSRCRINLDPRDSSGRAAGDDYELLKRALDSGQIDIGTYEEMRSAAAQGRAAAVSSIGVSMSCERDGRTQTAAVTVRMRR